MEYRKNIFYYAGLIPIILLILLVQLSSISCNKDDDSEVINKNSQELTSVDSANIKVSEWIYDWMEDVYYWNSIIPANIEISKKKNPEGFFYELLSQEDKWSYIANYDELTAELSGEYVSMGYFPYFGLLNNGNVFIIVLYVFPDSPAEKAGLQRGDIILTINGEYMDTTNYYDLFSQTSYTVELGKYNNGILYKSGIAINLNASSFDANPLLFDTILNVSDKKIGYAVYTEFITGDNYKYLTRIDSVFKAFKDSGITDLIIDLRYNPGGEITAAGYLASTIGPASIVNAANSFIKFKYNDKLQNYFESTGGINSENLVYQFPSARFNLNFNKVYFLTSYYTASASELLIIGLAPYMEVIQLGENTFGKYVGGWLLYDEHIPPKHNWAIIPIVFKYENIAGYTDFKNGLEPDYFIYDQLIPAEPFGSLDDPMLALAVEKITGKILKSTHISAKRNDYIRHYNNIMLSNSYLLVPHSINWLEDLKASFNPD
jgi:C-terminal processing protease CtpA/Prc